MDIPLEKLLALLSNCYLFIYKRVLDRVDQKDYNKLSFIIHKVRSPLT
jgi:hypothetical protein